MGKGVLERGGEKGLMKGVDEEVKIEVEEGMLSGRIGDKRDRKGDG
jgi:hypothetical protein